MFGGMFGPDDLFEIWSDVNIKVAISILFLSDPISVRMSAKTIETEYPLVELIPVILGMHCAFSPTICMGRECLQGKHNPNLQKMYTFVSMLTKPERVRIMFISVCSFFKPPRKPNSLCQGRGYIEMGPK